MINLENCNSVQLQSQFQFRLSVFTVYQQDTGTKTNQHSWEICRTPTKLKMAEVCL